MPIKASISGDAPPWRLAVAALGVAVGVASCAVSGHGVLEVVRPGPGTGDLAVEGAERVVVAVDGMVRGVLAPGCTLRIELAEGAHEAAIVGAGRTERHRVFMPAAGHVVLTVDDGAPEQPAAGVAPSPAATGCACPAHNRPNPAITNGQRCAERNRTWLGEKTCHGYIDLLANDQKTVQGTDRR